jgi:hypothetical protein
MCKYILLIVCVLLCSCCENDKKENFFSNEHKLYGRTIEIDCLIGKPTDIVCYDSLILFYDYYEDKAITVFDTKNEKFVRRFLNTGQGPEDIILPVKLISGKSLNVFQMQNARLYEYDIKDIVDTTQDQIKTVKKYQFDDRPANIALIQNGFVGIGMYDKGRYKLYDETGKTDRFAGKYPFRGENMNPFERFFIYQGALCSNPAGKHFVMGSYYCDNIEFYKIEKGEASLIKKYETYDVKGKFEQTIKLDDDCVMAYKGAYGTHQYCYVLYSGEKYGKRHIRTTGGTKIIVFDWNGAYIKTFEVDKTIFSFCVDKTNSVLFAITHDENEGFLITRYDLN